VVADSGRKVLLSRTGSCFVLIAAPELLPTLKKRPIDPDAELLVFADSDALKALEVMSERRPRVVALEKDFAATPRGAALIRRIKTDPALSKSEIRILSVDSDDPVVDEFPAIPHEVSVAAFVEDEGLDQRGTRRAPRFRIATVMDVVVDGNAATVIDLSTIGAQVVSSVVLRPTQRLRVTLADDEVTIRFNAIVAWASFEIPQQHGPRYRAGLEFIDADALGVDEFRRRHSS
jgi:PilZ domain